MKLNVGYFADGPWSHVAFEKIIKDNDIQISFICVRYDTQDETLKNYAKKHNIDYVKNKNINSEEFISYISKFECDLFVSMSFNQIFKTEIINLPKYKINIKATTGEKMGYIGREEGVCVHSIATLKYYDWTQSNQSKGLSK